MNQDQIVCLLYKYENSITARICRKSSIENDWWSFGDKFAKERGVGEIQEIAQCDLVIDADVCSGRCGGRK